MDQKNLTAIKDALSKEKTSLTTSAERIREDLETVTQDLRRVDAAIAALDGALHKRLGAKRAAKEKSKPSPPAPGKADVLKFMQTVLKDEGALDETTLRLRVEELAQESGFTRLGIALRFKEAMLDPRFVTGPDGVTLDHGFDASEKREAVR